MHEMYNDVKHILLSEEELRAKVAEMGAQITRDFFTRNQIDFMVFISVNNTCHGLYTFFRTFFYEIFYFFKGVALDVGLSKFLILLWS